jgi:hypothetical protein
MNVIGSNKRDTRMLGNANDTLIDHSLPLDVLILKLKIKVASSEDGIEPFCKAFGTLKVALDNMSRDITAKTCRKANESLTVTFKEVNVYSRLTIKALFMRKRYHIGQIFVSDLIFYKENEMVGLCFAASRVIETGIFCTVDLTAYNGLDALSLAGVVESNRTVHYSVIGKCNCIHSELLCSFGNVRYATRTVKKTVFTVQMQMDEIRHLIHLLC